MQSTQFHFALSEGIKLQRLYGGAGLVLLIDDGGQPEEPVELNRIRAIRGYIPLSRHELIPEDVSITDYSRPSHYRITTSQRITPDCICTASHVEHRQPGIRQLGGHLDALLTK